MNYALIQGNLVREIVEETIEVECPGTPTEENPSPEPVVRKVPLAERFHPDFVATLVRVPAGITVEPGDSYNGNSFGPPPAPPALTPAQVLGQRDALLAEATLRIAPLEDAVELAMATEEETASLKSWKQYRMALNRIEQQEGFPSSVVWPIKPGSPAADPALT
ncbi:tail fiber assembly protein [Variovorax ureilyticus]|uniref:tail fiber assembly protein n=1 Tax=Variovorax ureilyticus TaxID=1836198 RepID=UPI003D664256